MINYGISNFKILFKALRLNENVQSITTQMSNGRILGIHFSNINIDHRSTASNLFTHCLRYKATVMFFLKQFLFFFRFYLLRLSFFCLQLDAKNSPLALLAQTCSQIGADAQMPPNGKASSDKSNGGGHHKKPSSMSSMSSSDHVGGRDKGSPSLSSSSSSSCSNGGSPPSRSSANNSHNAQPTVSVTTTARSSFKPYESCVVRPAAEVATAISLDATIRRTIAPSAVNGGGDRCSSKESASSRKSPADDGVTGRKAQHEQPHKPSVSPSAASMAALMAAAGYPSPHHPAAHHLSHLPSHHHHMAALSSPLMSPYFRAGAVTPSLPCRDPYCGGCQLAAHLQTAGGKSQQPPAVPSPAAATTCPAGCTQCDNTASSPKTSAANVTTAHHHHPSTMSAHHHQQQQQQHHNTMAAAYAHAQLAALAAAASQLPYVCSWMGADLPSYCGKRFGTSDELLQHLRTHTADPAAALPLLQRSYPTPPLSPSAAAAANRYHPYAAAAAAAAAAKHHSPYGFPSGYPSSPLALSHHPGFLPPYFPAVAYSPYAAAAAAAASPRLGTSPHT